MSEDVQHEERSLEMAPPTGSGFGPEFRLVSSYLVGWRMTGEPSWSPRSRHRSYFPTWTSWIIIRTLRALTRTSCVTGATLETKFLDFGVKERWSRFDPAGHHDLQYLPAPGVKVSKIAGLQDDIAMALKALRSDHRADSGKGVVGIEIPNDTRQTVWIRDMLASEAFEAKRCSTDGAR